MRAFFLLMVLANAAFYAYTYVAGQQASADRQISLLQISPERIKLLRATNGKAAAQAKPVAAPATTASAAPTACIEWGILAGPEVTRAETALAKLDLPQALVQRAVTDAGGYWVYIPPLKTKGELDKNIEELKSLGVPDFFVVQDSTQWRNAISLGIFKSEDAARTFLEALRARGVRSAVAERREKFLRQIAYYVREPTEATIARLAEMRREFPGTQIKAVACPPAGA
jgi:hypothetical protein